MERVIENQASPSSLSLERSGNINKRKIEQKLQARRAQSLYTKTKVDKDNYDGESNQNPRGKPRRSASSTAVKIQVTFHRPLTWQVSSSSSSSAPIPKKSTRREPDEKSKAHVNPNNFVKINLNGNHIGSVQPPENEEDEFTFEIPIEKCEIARRNQRHPKLMRRRNHKNAENQTPVSSDSDNLNADRSGEAGHTKRPLNLKVRKRLVQSKKATHSRPGIGESEEESEDDPTIPVVKLSFQSSTKKPKVTAGTQSLHSQSDKQENLKKNCFNFPNRERHVSQGLHPAMTWFVDPSLHVNNTDRDEMGANGSSCNHTHHGGRLKSRSQSSSALYGVKPSVNNNGVLQHHQHSSQQQVYYEDSPYYNINAGSPARNNRYHHQGTNNGLSSSIPADLWDMPPSSKSYSPSRVQVQKQTRAQQLADPSRKQHRIIQIPAVEALINRGKKGARKGSTGREPVPEPHSISNRAKLYAVSCPDVAGNLDQEYYGPATALPHDEEDSSVQIPNSISHEREHHHHRRSHHGSHRAQTHQQHQHQKAWAERQGRSFEDHSHSRSSRQDMKCSFPIPAFPFITQDNIFELLLQRDQRGLGLGLSVTGGSDSQESFPGLIRVKKVFPMGPAFQSGRLLPWDIILKANGVPLTGLTNHEALEVLRTTPTDTVLTLCRLPPAYIPQLFLNDGAPDAHPILRKSSSKSQKDLSTGSQQYPPTSQFHARLSHQESLDPQTSFPPFATSFNSSVKSKSLSSLKIPSQQNRSYGEFEVTLEKIGGSLGFTLRQEDSSILGHYVRALVKDPALSDGRIQPGDRILSVNGQDLEGMSHADAIGFLRQCPPLVRLRFYRDPAPTPNSPLSPTESHKSVKEKTYRQEAIDMLNDLALRKQMSGSSDPKHSLPGSTASRTSGGGGLRAQHKQGQVDANGPATLPRRRAGHAGMTPSPEVLSAALDRFAGRSTPKSNQSPVSIRPRADTQSSGTGLSNNYPSETRSSGSGESTPASGTIIQNRKGRVGQGKPSSSFSDEHPHTDDETESMGCRKPSFRQYTMHLDRISSLEDESFSSDLNQNDSIVSAPGFGPSPTHQGNNFRAGQPAYQSAIVPSTRGMTRSRKNLSLSREEIEKHGMSGLGRSSRGGSDSPTALSDIDIPSSSKPNPLPSTQQTGIGSKASPVSDRKGKNTPSSSSGGASSRPLSSGGLVKWKGMLFSQTDEDQVDKEYDDDDDDDDDNLDSLDGSLPLRHPVLGESDGPTSSNLSSSTTLSKKSSLLQVKTPNGAAPLSQRQSPDGREFREGEASMIEVSSSKELFNGEQVLTVQLCRRWCSRLGFSIQGSNGHTYITVIYPDSVAGRDGRLHVGDEVIMVNDENIRNMATSEVIDLMRKTRGTISITLLRKPSAGDDAEKNNSSDSQLGLT